MIGKVEVPVPPLVIPKTPVISLDTFTRAVPTAPAVALRKPERDPIERPWEVVVPVTTVFEAFRILVLLVFELLVMELLVVELTKLSVEVPETLRTVILVDVPLLVGKQFVSVGPQGPEGSVPGSSVCPTVKGTARAAANA